MADFDYTCPNCKSEYRVVGTKIPMRDKDSEDCEICGEEIISWNGGIMYSAQLLVRREEYIKSENYEQILNLIEVIKGVEKTEKKEDAIKFITSEFDIPTHICNTCGTDSIIYLESESQVYCLYCDEHVAEDLYVECKCGGQGIIEEVRDEDDIYDEEAICLKCGKYIPPDHCWHGDDSGYNFPRVVVDPYEHGKPMYKAVCNRCYQVFYSRSLI